MLDLQARFSVFLFLSLSFSPRPLYLSLSRLLVVGIDFRGREIAWLAGPLACLAAALGPQSPTTPLSLSPSEINAQYKQPSLPLSLSLARSFFSF